MKRTKKLVAILISLIMVLSVVPFNVWGAESGEGNITLQIDITSNDNETTASEVKVNGATWTDHNDVFKTSDGKYVVSGKINVQEGKEPKFGWGGNLNDYMSQNAQVDIEKGTDTEYSFSITLNNIGTAVDDQNNLINFIGFNLEAEQINQQPSGDNNNNPEESNNNQGNENQPGGTTTRNYNGNETAILNYKITGAIEYTEGAGFENGIGFRINEVSYEVDHSKEVFDEEPAYERDENGQYILNENNEKIPVRVPGPNGVLEQITEKTGVTITGDIIHYDNNADTNKVKFTFVMNPGTLMTGLKINGVTINNLPKTKETLSACYIDHRLEIEVDNIDKADIYNIEITARYPNENEQFLGNFLWDYNPKGYTGPDDKVLNATLTFVEAEYNGKIYKTPEEINKLGGVFIWKDAERKKKYSEEREGLGEAQFPTGTKLTVKIIPDAGYQLVDFGINGGIFDPQEEIGTYTFEVKGGPFHLQATIKQVEDVVKTKSEKIESGKIELGGKETSMNVGTARLDVKDIELDKEQISNFEEAAEGYDIKNYIDISLFNTVFKGKETASWDTQVKELENEATISLKLEEGTNGNEVVIVHEKHDGTFEIIPVTYNVETNTITFKTKSFSNYAIATKADKEKDVEKDDKAETEADTENATSSPKTGDNVIVYAAIFVTLQVIV